MNSNILSQANVVLCGKRFRKTSVLYLCLLFALTFGTVKANTIYTWTGATSTDWADSTNWSPMSATGGPYGCSVDIIIPVTANSPVIVSSVIAANVHINDYAQLTLNGNISLCANWAGGTTGYATVIGAGVVSFESNTMQFISGITQMNELRLDNTYGVTMQSGAVLDLYTALDIKAGNFDATSGSLTFKSNAPDSVAFIDNFTEGNILGTVTGPVTVERWYASSVTYNQHFLGSPVNSPPLTQFGAIGTPGFVQNPTCDETHSVDITSPYGTLFTLHESNGAVCALQQWEVVTSGNAQNALGYSYLKAGPGKLILNGTLNLDTMYSTGGVTNSGWSNTSLQGHTYTSGWQLISNPYLAELDLTQTPAGFDNQVQVWNAEGPYAGTYQPVMMGINANIAPFQAFMVHKTAVGGTAAYVINGSERTRNISNFYLLNANQLNIVAANTANGLLDQTTVLFNTAATDSFDPQYDAAKFPGVLNRQTIYTDNSNVWMARNVLQNVTAVNTIPMGFEPGATGTYSLTFNGLNTFDASAYIYLEDKTAHVMYNVRNGNYTFTADSADTWNRFVLHFNPAVQVTATAAGCTSFGSIQITQAGVAYWYYTITDSTNTVISGGVIDQNHTANVEAPAGSYTLTLVDSNNYTVVKTIVINGVQAATASFVATENTVQTNQSITLTAAAGNVSYQWTMGNGTTATGATATVSYINTGTYTIRLLVQNQAGCAATSAQTISVTAPSGIPVATASEKPVIWSNSSIIYADFANVQFVDATIIVYDILGRQVSSEKVTSSSLYQLQINNIQAGYFIVEVANNNTTTTQKVLITNAR
jgi:chitodextrinase